VLLLVLEISAYLAVRVIEQLIAEGSGSLFGADVPRNEHEHDSPTSESGLKRPWPWQRPPNPMWTCDKQSENILKRCETGR
jgi:hypothetical protein